ncbi:unnamed protein product [Dicrocoelium dendriticum]|nr:unnamed protein product [Dicrocoelium dendriticum]
MSNREAVDSGGDIRMREIQASIAEGKMMLHVLKSLPSSEVTLSTDDFIFQNNDAFILRFEELVSRLENYRTQLNNTSVSFTGLNECMQNAVDVHSFIEIIKERQEKIAHLFAQTAKRFQQASESVPATNTESVSMCSGSPPTLSQSASSAPPTKIENSFNSTTPATSNCASADVSLPSLKKSAHFSFELDRLTAFTEDAKRFEGMTGRLVDITGRAHLTEATEFLCEIRARFIELQRSFSSLRETYESYHPVAPGVSEPGARVRKRGTRHPDFPVVDELTKNRLLTRHEELPENLDKHFEFYHRRMDGPIKRFVDSHDPAAVITVNGALSPSNLLQAVLVRFAIMARHPGVPTSILFPEDGVPDEQDIVDTCQCQCGDKQGFSELSRDLWSDRVPHVLILGNSCCGKTTLAKRLY